jgi:hypothetical protein
LGGRYDFGLSNRNVPEVATRVSPVASSREKIGSDIVTGKSTRHYLNGELKGEL